MAGLNPFRVYSNLQTKAVILDSLNRSQENSCFMANISSGTSFLTILCNGNSLRGLNVMKLMDVGDASSFISIKILDNNIYMSSTGNLVFRIYIQYFSTPIVGMKGVDIDLSSATTIPYI